MRPIRILIVDDSAFMRMTLSRRLAGEPDFEIAGTAGDGNEALAQVQKLQPDVVTLDVEMPQMDGLGVLAQIMATRPTPVIMVSSLTQAGAETTVRALTLGAFDFVPKPSQTANTAKLVADLSVKIRQAAAARVGRVNRAVPAKPAPVREKSSALRPLGSLDQILVIGSSTGGPAALRHLFSDLPLDAGVAALVVQHMPVGFTRSLADRLNENSAWSVKEAQPGDRLLCGQALVAPGGWHLVCNRRGEVFLNQDPQVNNVRPSVDVTMTSVAADFGRRVTGVVLTGMGHDGKDGSALIRQAGGQILAEAESSCVVYGMPRSVIEAGLANHVAPISEMGAAIHRALKERVA